MIPVKLPKEVLSLFPTWEYRCPKCSTYVESNKSFCPNCKMPFDEKRWRVPPRFFKSHDAMSEYAHKVLAPKLTPEQRELLFHYFTELFKHGFEGGDFGEDPETGDSWTGTVGTPSVSSAQAHHGIYSMLIETTDNLNHGAYKTITASSGPIYVRLYVYFTALSSDGNYMNITQIIDDSGWGTIARVIYSSGVPIFQYYNNYYGQTIDTSVTVQTGQWYCVELLFYKYGTGQSKLYIDGNLEATDTGNNPNTNVTTVYACGQNHYYYEAYFDCVVVADTYIGPETAGQTYTKTWTMDALFKKLGIPKSLGVDTAFQKQDIPKTFGINAEFLKRDLIKSFTVDARFGALMTQTISRQIDVLLKKLDLTKNFGLDVYFGPFEAETYAKTFALDAIFAYKVRLPELWLDENGKIVLNISKPYTWVGS